MSPPNSPSSTKVTPPHSPNAENSCEEETIIISEDGTKKLIKTRCDECLKQFRKAKAINAFPKCAEMGKFTKKMENTEKLVKNILLRESKGEILTGRVLNWKKRALRRLGKDSAAGARFNRVLVQRHERFCKKNGKDEDTFLAEKADLMESDTEENFYVPPMPKSKQEAEAEDIEMSSKLEL